MYRSFRPFVGTLGISAHVVKPHIVFSPTTLALEENGLFMATLRTGVFFSSWKCRVVYNVGNYSRQFIDFVSDFIDINAIIVCDLLIVTVSTGVKQYSGLFIFARIQHIIAFLTELNSDKFRALRLRLNFRYESGHTFGQYMVAIKIFCQKRVKMVFKISKKWLKSN